MIHTTIHNGVIEISNSKCRYLAIFCNDYVLRYSNIVPGQSYKNVKYVRAPKNGCVLLFDQDGNIWFNAHDGERYYMLRNSWRMLFGNYVPNYPVKFIFS